jgi:very-short-patch-repair endonuclease
MRVNVSHAELLLFEMLQVKRLTRGMVTQKAIVLKDTTREDEREFPCIPDFYWRALKLAVDLDGFQVHKRFYAQSRDEKIDRLLKEQYDIDMLRFSYEAPISMKCLSEITRVVEAAVKEREKTCEVKIRDRLRIRKQSTE